jgi:hypothetical protein
MNDYFQSSEKYFWQWEDDGAVVAIPQSNTIAYRDYLGDIIEKLSLQGLPPFGALLLVITATNPNGAASLDAVYRIVSDALKTTDENVLTRAINFLKLLAELPQPFREREKRMLILQVLFERCHNVISVKSSKAVVQQYKEGFNTNEKVGFNRSVFDKDFRTLSLLESKFPDVASIIQAIAALPDPNQFELEFDEQTSSNETATLDFVDELVNNNKTHTVGSLIRWLWGGLNIPVHSSLPSQQPLGGISDLTNKGDFDKLLISEFANDDLFFLSRLANNEALYIHREIPPANNNLHRFVLIDATLKNWGNPKAIAFALTLAIARHPKTDVVCSAFVLGDTTYYPVSIDSIESIIDAMYILGGNLHAGNSLEEFLKDFATDDNKEIFLVTEKSTVRQPGMLKVVNEFAGKIHYFIQTDAQGNIDVYKKHGNGKNHIQHLKLPLEKLWKKKSHTSQKEPRATKFNVDYPILLRSERNGRLLLSAADGEIFQCTTERSLLRLFDPSNHTKRGWDLVCRDLPYRTDICEIGMTDSGEYILLLFNTNDRETILFNLQTGEKYAFFFNHWKSTTVPSFIFDSGKFVHYNNNGQWSISPEGKVEVVENMDRNKFLQHSTAVSEMVLKYTSHYGIFKNINKIYINGSGELVLNVHTLKLIGNGAHLKFVPTNDHQVKFAATESDDHIFTFDDGSSIEVNRNGLLIFRSSDRILPTIYIPTTLDASLGIATSSEFAGNDYYLKEQSYRVVLKDHGSKQSELMKLVEDLIQLPLEKASELLACDLPVTLIPFCLKQKALNIQSAFVKAGAVVELKLSEGQIETEIKKIPVSLFFDKHIMRFINTIVNYGVTNNRKR